MSNLQNKSDIFTSVLGAIGISVSVESLDSILNLVLLVISIVNIVVVLGLRIYNAVKNKNVDEVKKAVEEAKEDLDDIKRNDK